jgi:hypothetical protein
VKRPRAYSLINGALGQESALFRHPEVLPPSGTFSGTKNSPGES